MPVPETDRQRRWSFAAERRGELPKGTAKRWARETKKYCKRCKGGECACKCKHKANRGTCLLGRG